MTSGERVTQSILRLPLVRPAVRRAYRSGYRLLEQWQLTKPNALPEIRVSPAGTHSFFGYYDKSPWDPSGRFLVFMSVDFADRMPGAQDVARIWLVDALEATNRRMIAETRAWCWQQGAMLQWLGGTGWLVFNDVANGRYVSRIVDMCGNPIRTLPRPIYALSRDGTQALSLDFERVHFARPGYGYAAGQSTGNLDRRPSDNGVWLMDMATGDSTLIITLAQLAERWQGLSVDDAFHYVLHLEFNPGATRFVVLHRCFGNGHAVSVPHATRMYTANADGSKLHLLEDSGVVSHFAWKDDWHLLATSRRAELGFNYHLYEDLANDVSIVGEGILTGDGHPSYSPSKRWLLTDTYPDRVDKRWLILYDIANRRRIDLGRYASPVEYSGPIRCDLHPRWNHDEKWVCFDSAHEGTRGVYAVDVSSITGGRA